jgi:4-alpha-glucanotransferase
MADMADPSLTAVADRLGVACAYHDWTGNFVTVDSSTVVAVLAALGVRADNDEACAAALSDLDRQHWSRALPPTVVTRSGTEASFWVHVTHGAPAQVWVRLEDGTVRSDIRQADNWNPPFDLGDRLVGEATFVLPADLPLGYHRIHLRSGDEEFDTEEFDTEEFDTEEFDTALIVTPAWLGLPARMGARRVWGLATQLYSVQSKGSWGFGDLADLADLAVWAGSRHGAGYVLVNPLHAASPTSPMEPSPYLPTSRRFFNPLYLRVEAIPEFAALARRDRVRNARKAEQRRARKSNTIDRDGVWAAKRKALKVIYREPRSAGRELAFTAFKEREGTALDDFATWCAVAEKHGGDWKSWPAQLQNPASPAVADFAERNSDAVDFHRWLQWQLDDQLAHAQSQALRTGMPLGIMGDLAVGVHPTGADAWSLQDVLALGVTAGAPPDEFNQLGQDWSQPPWRPDQLEELGYQPFRELIAAILRHSGGVRIDHVIGLFRLWWIPQGAPPTQGTYVRYNHDAMIGIVALEAHRAGAVVVGEDLGTVEPWVRDYLRDRGVLGTSILWFEIDADNRGPLQAQHWRELCLSSVTTHDLPPTPGYLDGAHVRLRHELGLLTRSAQDELADDRAQQEAWMAELRRAGLLGAEADEEDVTLALYRYLGRTRSRLLALALTDAVGERRTQNQPGTTDEYPNWRVPLNGPDGKLLLLEDVFTDRRAAELAEAMRAATDPGTG